MGSFTPEALTGIALFSPAKYREVEDKNNNSSAEFTVKCDAPNAIQWGENAQKIVIKKLYCESNKQNPSKKYCQSR